jgi:RHS repeat-associated protein
MQSFDQYGRLNQVAVDGITNAFTYGYLEGSHFQKTLAMPNGVTRTFGYEANRDLLKMIIHSNATERLVQRDFTFDGLGRLSNRTLFRANETPVAPDAFAYNSRSELTNALYQIRQSGTNAIRQFSYDFDPIGNRLASTEFGTNTAYITSALNQYTSISNSVSSVPLCEMNPEFDADGNQTLLKTATGIWHVTYNAENRPVIFTNETTKVEMAYDYMGRRFEYKETVNGTLTRHERCLYRDYLQIAALDMLNGASVKHSIVWDASERAATRPLALQIGANAYFYSFDQVKNVTELFDSTGSISATYDYSPFGQIVASTGAIANPITFSSEIYDSTLGLQYYNYRNLNTLDGRWINSDPIGESGGINGYALVCNRTMSSTDLFGLTVTYGIHELRAFDDEAGFIERWKKDSGTTDSGAYKDIKGKSWVTWTAEYAPEKIEKQFITVNDKFYCKKKLVIKKDTEVKGNYYWLKDWGSVILPSGRTVAQHEYQHVLSQIAAAIDFDIELEMYRDYEDCNYRVNSVYDYLSAYQKYLYAQGKVINTSIEIEDYLGEERRKQMEILLLELTFLAEAEDTYYFSLIRLNLCR